MSKKILYGLTAQSGGGGSEIDYLAPISSNQGDPIDYVNNEIMQIRWYGFSGTSSTNRLTTLKSIKCNNVRTINPYAFYYCDVETAEFTEVTTIKDSAFAYCEYLKSIICPKVTTLNTRAFQNCFVLKSISLPLLTTVIQTTFFNCYALENVDLPLVTTLYSSAFERCSSLTNVSFPSLTSMSQYVFSSCDNLQSITLGANQVCTAYTNSIPASATHHITIYVPSNLINDYKSATNWSTLYNDGYIDFQAIAE